jgi:hypothetical protein
MTSSRHLVPVLLLTLFLGACGKPAATAPVTVRVEAAPLTLAVSGEGELRAIKATPLLVPGAQWTPRQLAWMLPDGSQVKQGEVVARFSAEQSKQDLAQALVDLQRNLLARAGKQAELGTSQGQLGVDLSDVATQLAIARRYANAGLAALARNQVLDAVQDAKFLQTKQGILDWRRDQSSTRGKAELAVLDAQRATYTVNEKQKRADLDALELHAPHDGVLVLESDWSGTKPAVGASMWAGNTFGSLPDTHAMEVQIAVPQVQAQGIKVGDAVEMHPLGLPGQSVTAKLSWVAEAAAPRSRQSPVKYLLMKAPVPAQAIARYGWVPGQHFSARVILLDARQALSVPNLAIDSHGDKATVTLREGGDIEHREVSLGVRGATRSQVLSGLRPGDEVVLDVGAARTRSRAGAR